MQEAHQGANSTSFFLIYERKTADSITDINSAFGTDTVSKSTAYDWYARFKKGNENLNDLPRSGRPSEFDNSFLKEALEVNKRQTTRELADLLGVTHTTIIRHLADDIRRKRQWVDAGAAAEREPHRELHPRKIMLSVFCDSK